MQGWEFGLVRVPYPDLPQDRLHVDLDGRLGDVAHARNHLVGMPLHETIENLGLALRKCRHTPSAANTRVYVNVLAPFIAD